MKFIPNQQSWIGFNTTITGVLTGGSAGPKAADITAATDLTTLVQGISASTQGNTVPTPTFDTTFETNVQGTAQGSFSADFYYDTVVATNKAWTTLPRGAAGFFTIARYGVTTPGAKPALALPCELWPVVVTSRSVGNMTSGQIVTFTVSCAIPAEPNESCTVQA